jgi:hypothetical protein
MADINEIEQLKEQVASLTAIIEKLKQPAKPELEKIRVIRNASFAAQSEERQAKIRTINEAMQKHIVEAVLDNIDFENIRLGNLGLTAQGLYGDVSDASLDKMLLEISRDRTYRETFDRQTTWRKQQINVIRGWIKLFGTEGLPHKDYVTHLVEGTLSEIPDYVLDAMAAYVRVAKRDRYEQAIRAEIKQRASITI